MGIDFDGAHPSQSISTLVSVDCIEAFDITEPKSGACSGGPSLALLAWTRPWLNLSLFFPSLLHTLSQSL